jgi:hypothetical protein
VLNSSSDKRFRTGQDSSKGMRMWSTMRAVDNEFFAITLYLDLGSGPPVPAFFELGSLE